MRGRRAAAAMIAACGLLAGTQASAFVQTQTCDPSGSGGFPCSAGETPRPVFWPSKCIQYHINEETGEDLTLDEARDAIIASFDAWNEVGCSELSMEFAGLSDEDRVGFNRGAGFSGNANVIMVREGRWDHQSGVVALTSVTFNPTNGHIADADIEINGVDFDLTVADRNVRIDVRNTMTHEAGHFLGLDHTRDSSATMFATAPLGETAKRTLESDDIDGVCAAYPVGGLSSSACLGGGDGFYERDRAGDCDGRFFAECGDQVIVDSGGGCSVASAASPGGGAGWLGLALLGFVVASRRRRSAASGSVAL